jgi:hypothetical protein
MRRQPWLCTQESPEEATIQILDLMLSDEALLACGVGDENKVELDPKILEGVVGTHNVNYYLTCNYTLSRTTSKYHPHKNAENSTNSSSCYHVPFHFLKTFFDEIGLFILLSLSNIWLRTNEFISSDYNRFGVSLRVKPPCAKQCCNSTAAAHHAKECGMQYCNSAALLLRAAQHEWHMGTCILYNGRW